ncbi:monocarboxylate transporter 3-like [Orbicella faveolata]|uniref:monocarboxylate transporter 3-like n=1 Tax=Orbicella faveolata TaxID=48498 RepID=UPI0009E3D757|nr:monocarboxylate transporter 3-like [Orbicella faveolata]
MAHKQDGKWSWLVCFSATLSWLGALGFLFSFGIFFPVFMDYFHESREKTAWVGSLAMALTNFSGLVSGALIKRFGCRFTTLVGGFLCALSLGLSSLAKNILTLFLTYSALYGLGTSCVLSASLNIISKYFKKRRSMATGIVACGQGGGVLILGPVLQTMINAFGWQTTYQIMAGVVLSLCLSGLTYSPNVEHDELQGDVVEVEGSASSADGAQNELVGHERGENTKTSVEEEKRGCHAFLTVWKEPKFVALVASSSVMMFGHFVPQIHLVRFCEDIGITADAASRLFIYYGLASCIARLISGRLCDFQKVNTFYVYQAAELVLGTTILVVTMASSYAHMIAFVVIYGFCDGLFITTLNVLVITCVSQSQVPFAIGWELQITSIVVAGGPPAAGLMADSLGTYTHAFYMSGAVVIAGACIPFLLLFTNTKEPGTRTRETLSDLWELNGPIKEIPVTMDTEQGGETEADPSSGESFIVWTSSV